jgi:nucleotide-binding universal stress UspA family protein
VADVTRSQHIATIVVGLDHNSSHDGAVLAAALDRACQTGSVLRVVHAIAPDANDRHGAAADAAASRTRRTTRQNHQNAILDDLRRHTEVEMTHPGPLPTVEYSVRHGDPATVLLWAAQHADLIVVGTRGASHRSALLLGTVSQDVAVHATCPVLLIPTP